MLKIVRAIASLALFVFYATGAASFALLTAVVFRAV